MNLKYLKPYHLFFVVALLHLLIGIKSFYDDTTLDINLHDTYYVIPSFYFAFILFICYFFQGLGYWVFQKALKRKLVKWLTFINTFIMIGSFVYYWLFTGYYKYLAENSNPLLYDSYQTINITLTILTLLIFFIAVPAFIINLIIGVFRKTDRFIPDRF